MSGGIRTLDDLRNRCHVDDITGCWHWRLSDRVWLPALHSSRSIAVAALFLDGRKPRGDYRTVRSCSCEDCANPAHVVGMSIERFGKHLADTGRLKGSPKRAAACHRNSLPQRALSEEQVAEALASNETAQALARRWGVDETVVGRIRRGQSYRPAPQMAGSSAFTWRPNKTTQEAQCP